MLGPHIVRITEIWMSIEDWRLQCAVTLDRSLLWLTTPGFGDE
jgi:hypothetical protein